MLEKNSALPNIVASVDGAEISRARPSNCHEQNVAYNDHKRKRAPKLQVFALPDGPSHTGNLQDTRIQLESSYIQCTHL